MLLGARFSREDRSAVGDVWMAFVVPYAVRRATTRRRSSSSSRDARARTELEALLARNVREGQPAGEGLI